jgi:HemY protein
MLWSLIRIFLFVGIITAAAFGVAFLIENGGQVRLSFAGTEYTFEPLIGLIGVALFLVAVWAVVKILGLMLAVFRFFNGDETAISRYFFRNRQKRGYEALADGMVAIAAGEGRLAVAKAMKAEKLLDRSPLTQLVNAQAAEMSGDKSRALTYYKGLLENDQTRFVGVQGILKQRLAEGDTDTALKLAEKAFALRPQHKQTIDVLFKLQTDKAQWEGAGKTVAAQVRTNILTSDVGKRREAVLALANARLLLDEGDVIKGKERALESNRLSPDLVPAAVLAAEMKSLEDNKRAALKIIKKAWTANPHPDLASAFAEIEPDETAVARLKRFTVLTKIHPDHSETKMLLAELMLAAEDFPGARRAIGNLAEENPTTRSLAIMAAIARGEGGAEQVVRGWLAKALDASRGPQWVCESCNKVHTAWAPKCDNCDGFDTMAWVTPPQSEGPASSVAMLPLMGGLLAENEQDESDTAVVDETPKEA